METITLCKIVTYLQYFVNYKLSEEYTGIDTNYAKNFLSYLGFAAQIPNLLFNWLNIFLQFGYVYKIYILQKYSIFYITLIY